MGTPESPFKAAKAEVVRRGMCGFSSVRKKVLWLHSIFVLGAGPVTPVLCPALSSYVDNWKKPAWKNQAGELSDCRELPVTVEILSHVSQESHWKTFFPWKTFVALTLYVSS